MMRVGAHEADDVFAAHVCASAPQLVVGARRAVGAVWTSRLLLLGLRQSISP